MKTNRSSFLIEYPEGWMITLFDGDMNVNYFNSAEDDWEDVLEYEELFMMAGKINNTRHRVKLGTYQEVSEINIFDLGELLSFISTR